MWCRSILECIRKSTRAELITQIIEDWNTRIPDFSVDELEVAPSDTLFDSHPWCVLNHNFRVDSHVLPQYDRVQDYQVVIRLLKNFKDRCPERSPNQIWFAW